MQGVFDLLKKKTVNEIKLPSDSAAEEMKPLKTNFAYETFSISVFIFEIKKKKQLSPYELIYPFFVAWQPTSILRRLHLIEEFSYQQYTIL